MRHGISRLVSTFALATALSAPAACGETAAPETALGGGELAIEVAPLTLPGVTNARYTITVTNGADGGGEVVWTRTLESTQYGDGAGALAYVGPCDADTGTGSVELVLEELYEGNGVPIATGTYMNPTPLIKNATCVAGTDVPVTFDITIARAASQGFFDVAVSFDDIFCSAKLDCVRDGTNDDLELLHNPLAGNQRDLTAVLGLACTASPTASETYLYMDRPVITCTGLAQPITVDITGLGNVNLAAAPSSNPDGYLFGAAVYRGNELLAAKSYWNVDLGLNDQLFASAGTCTLTGRATASAAAWAQTPQGFEVPEGNVYPVIDWTVTLSDGGARACTAHALNDGSGDIATQYVGYLSAPNQFTWAPDPIYLDYRFERSTEEVLGASAICYPDIDGDGFGDAAAAPFPAADGSCDLAQNESANADDCDDADLDVHPGADEIADDGIDQDCSGTDTVTCYVDADADGYGGLAATTVLAPDGSCDAADHESDTADDCNDADAGIHPGATEIPDDGIDQDCSGGDLITIGPYTTTSGNANYSTTLPKDSSAYTRYVGIARASGWVHFNIARNGDTYAYGGFYIDGKQAFFPREFGVINHDASIPGDPRYINTWVETGVDTSNNGASGYADIWIETGETITVYGHRSVMTITGNLENASPGWD
ncbi:MAG: hypothetical protein EP329_10100 [Deltaproteobacteria bacterium]|nr:MAG: hypothetical protein EP329_10100 [Deltaproteobacteria bacterium]